MGDLLGRPRFAIDVMNLFISHAPGTTQADSQYREWERLFGHDDWQQRLSVLGAYGIDHKTLPAEIETSVQLLTQVEVGARLIAQQYGVPLIPEIDGAAAILRVTRSLAQRRNRGHECVDFGFLDASVAILTDLGLPTGVTTQWTRGIEVLACASRPSWSTTEIEDAASSLPLAVVNHILQSISGLSTVGDVLSAGTAVDWLLQDVALLLSDAPRTGHTAPISDALVINPHVLDQRTQRVLAVLDVRARHFSGALEADLPPFISDHFGPVRHMVGIVATGLEQRGLL